MRAVDPGAVVDVEDVDGAVVFVDSVNDPVGAASGSMAAGQGAEQRLTDAGRADGERGFGERPIERGALRDGFQHEFAARLRWSRDRHDVDSGVEQGRWES